MFKIGLQIFLRRLLKNRFDTLIMLLGLILGISSLIVISIMMITELSYDRFHKDSERIYRVDMTYLNRDGIETESPMLSPLHGDYLHSSIPGVETVTRMFTYSWKEEVMIEYGDKNFFESNVFLIDRSFFNMFSFELLEGNRESLFSIENAVVLSQECARKYFGEENPLGKVVHVKNFGNIPLVVSGIMRSSGYNSHFHFDLLIPSLMGENIYWKNFLSSWFNNSFYTYIKLNSDADPDQVLRTINSVLALKRDERLGEQNYYLTPLTSIHLYSKHTSDIEPGGDIRQVYFLLLIGLMISIITLSNYSSITSIQVYSRAREVGIKKLFGESKLYLNLQMLIESAILNIIAFTCAFMLVDLLSPVLELYLNTDLSIYYIFHNHLIFIILICVTFCIVGAIIPSALYSSYKVMEVLKGHFRKGSRIYILRKLLIAVQYILVSLILTCAIFIFLQQRYLLKQHAGLSLENIIIVPLRDHSSKKKYEDFKNKLLSYPEISNVSASSSLPINTTAKVDVVCDGQVDIKMVSLDVDFGFIEMFGMEIVSGRSFDPLNSTEKETAYIINETAVAALSWDTIPGKNIQYSNKGLKYPEFSQGNVIGIVKDFNHASMYSNIQPLIMKIGKHPYYVSIKTNHVPEKDIFTIIENVFKRVYGTEEVSFYTAGNKYSELYADESQLSRLFALSTLFTLLIMSISLAGIVRFDLRRKYRAIGIRKVFGASGSVLLFHYIKRYVIFITISYLVSTPVTFFMVNEWLSRFSFSIHISPIVFITALSILLIISLPIIVVSVYAAYQVRPVLIIRNE